MNRRPFIAVSWESDFLSPMLQHALNQGDLAESVFIFPHQRPEQYLTHMLRTHPGTKRPLILPRCYPVSALFSLLRENIIQTPAWNAGLLDRVGLLLEIIRADTLLPEQESIVPFLRDAELFFPWGVRLAALFEECFTQLAYPQNFLYMESEVSPFASALLARLAGIFETYTEELKKREWTTPGFDALRVAEHLRAHQELPERFFHGKQVYIAGFHALTESENVLFHHLWSQCGATVLLHADPALAQGKKSHWSCGCLEDWIKKWKATCVAPDTKPLVSGPRRIQRYYEGFDLHSQLQSLSEKVAADVPCDTKTDASPALFSSYAATTGVVLPDSGLLMPVLHHLPRNDINISMGYPLSRSPLFQLLETIFRLQETRKGNRYYWRGLIELARHPYLKMLEPALPQPSPGTGKTTPASPLRKELHRFEEAVRDFSSKYPEPYTIWQLVYGPMTQEDLPDKEVLLLLDQVFKACLSSFETPSTPQEMGTALENLCRILLQSGSHLWERFPVDAECLHRLLQSTIPELMHSSLANEQFPLKALISLTRQLMEAERVPFEASPLVGMQVLGVLETRLLTFERLFLLETTEDCLPGTPSGDPLLPDALRPVLGLPPVHTREQVAAYHFFRLVYGASQVHIFWQEGQESGIFDQRKKKSRFVEELLWEEEKKRGQIFRFQGQDGPLTTLAAQLAPSQNSRIHLPLTPEMHQLVRETLKKSVSPSLLDAYIQCPVRFYFERVIKFTSADDVNEGDDPLTVGVVLHEALQQFFTHRLYRIFPDPDVPLDDLADELMDALQSAPAYPRLTETLPADALAMFKTATRIRLRDFLSRQQPTRVLALETPFQASRLCDGESYALMGKVDRIDLRGETLIILDYKTGEQKRGSDTFWTNIEIWNKMNSWSQETSPADNAALLDTVAKGLGSIQLPFYMMLFQQSAAALQELAKTYTMTLSPAPDAGFVALGNQGEERLLFGPEASTDDRQRCASIQTPLLVDFLLRHMTKSTVYMPRPSDACAYCSAAGLCVRERT